LSTSLLHGRFGAPILAGRNQLTRNPPCPGRPWTAADDRLVLALPPPEAARRLGRTLPAVYGRRSKLHADSLKRPWTPAEDRLLMRLPADVAVRYLNRPLNALDQRRRKLGLVKDRVPNLW
jgi:hypothetical protein